MRALLVDDERLARVALRKRLEGHPEVEVIGEAGSVDEAVRQIGALDPDLIFLDVSMPGGDGFELLARLPLRAQVIFVTAFTEFAWKAFEVDAADYLVKPVTSERLAAALHRLAARRGQAEGEKLTPTELLCLPTGKGLRFFRVADISHVVAADDYTVVHLDGGDTVISATALKDWEKRLPDDFLRVHRSALVQASFVTSVSRGDGEVLAVHLPGGRRVDPDEPAPGRGVAGEVGEGAEVRLAGGAHPCIDKVYR